MSEHPPEKTPRHPAEAGVDFWRKEAGIQAAALEGSRRENIHLEQHHREALAEIARLRGWLGVIADLGGEWSQEQARKALGGAGSDEYPGAQPDMR